jgi:hypothetical protein
MAEDDHEAAYVAESERLRLEIRRTLEDIKGKRLTPSQREAIIDRSRALVYRTKLLIQHLKARTRLH